MGGEKGKPQFINWYCARHSDAVSLETLNAEMGHNECAHKAFGKVTKITNGLTDFTNRLG